MRSTILWDPSTGTVRLHDKFLHYCTRRIRLWSISSNPCTIGWSAYSILCTISDLTNVTICQYLNNFFFLYLPCPGVAGISTSGARANLFVTFLFFISFLIAIILYNMCIHRKKKKKKKSKRKEWRLILKRSTARRFMQKSQIRAISPLNDGRIKRETRYRSNSDPRPRGGWIQIP